VPFINKNAAFLSAYHNTPIFLDFAHETKQNETVLIRLGIWLVYSAKEIPFYKQLQEMHLPKQYK
jgi:hypothetical protein